MSLRVKDKLQKKTKALPAGAASTTSDALDLENTTRGEQVSLVELLITYPALALALLPDTKTMTYTLLGSANSDLSAPTVSLVIKTQTGATGTDPCAGGEIRYKPASDAPRYWGIKATGVATVDGSTKSMTIEMVF